MSRWSRLSSIPVSVLGALVYGILAATAIALSLHIFPQHRPLLQLLQFTLALIGGGSAAWFLFLQIAVLRRFCLYCNLVHLLGVTAMALVLVESLHTRSMQTGQMLQTPASIAAGALALLILGQLILRSKMYAVRVVESPGKTMATKTGACNAVAVVCEVAPSNPTSNSSDRSFALTAAPVRHVSLLQGRIRLALDDWPLLGSCEAEHSMAVLFDYTCQTCRRTHQVLKDAVQSSGSSLAVLEIPIPQNPACNSAIKKLLPGRAYACQYARLALGLWQTRPDCYDAFADYMFSEKEPPPLGLAIAKAKELTGSSLDPHHPEEETERRIRQAIEIYRSLEIQKVPQILLPKSSITGEITSASELRLILSKEFHGMWGSDK